VLLRYRLNLSWTKLVALNKAEFHLCLVQVGRKPKLNQPVWGYGSPPALTFSHFGETANELKLTELPEKSK
jgi:hypothetical protein